MKTMKTKRLMARICLVLVTAFCAGMAILPPAWAAGERRVWTVREAEMARKFSAGNSLKEIINDAVKSGYSVDDAVATAIRADLEPFYVVSTAISEGYPEQAVVRAALQAGAPLTIVVNAATRAGAVRRTIYRGAREAGASSSAVLRAMDAVSTPGVAAPVPSSRSEATFSAVPAPAIIGRGGVVLPPALPEARQNLQAGPLMINPFLSVSEVFRDNVFFTEADRKEDTITVVTPGLRMQLFRRAELEYYPVITRYRKYREEDITDHYAAGTVEINPGDFGLRLSDSYAREHEPRSSTPAGAVEEFFSNVASASAEYRFTDFSRLRIGYDNVNRRFLASRFRDREEDRLSGAVHLEIGYGTSAFIEYDHASISYDDASLGLDSRIETVQGGLDWHFSDRFRGTIKGGLSRKDLKSNEVSGTVKVGSADIRHDVTKDTAIVLTAVRNVQEPNIPGQDYFISTGGYGELTERFTPTLSAVVRGSYVEDNYRGIRIDRTTLGGAGLKWRAGDWLELALDYNRLSRHTSTGENEYREQSAGITANMSL